MTSVSTAGAPQPQFDAAELLELGSATLYEASGLDCDLDAALRPAWPGAQIVGTALPVQTAPGDNLPLHIALEAARPGEVLVVSINVAAGRSAAAHGYWGEVLAVAAQARQVSGLIIDGGVRDTGRLEALEFPVFSRCVAIRGTVKSWPGRIGEPATVGGRPVRRGDLVVADRDGVVVIPAEQAEPTLAAARQRQAKEDGYLTRLRNGELTLDIYDFRSLL